MGHLRMILTEAFQALLLLSSDDGEVHVLGPHVVSTALHLSEHCGGWERV